MSEINTAVIFLLGFAVGSLIAVFITAILLIRRCRKDTVGTLQIIESDNEEPYLFLALDTDVKYFAHEPTVLLNVTCKQASHK